MQQQIPIFLYPIIDELDRKFKNIVPTGLTRYPIYDSIHIMYHQINQNLNAYDYEYEHNDLFDFLKQGLTYFNYYDIDKIIDYLVDSGILKCKKELMERKSILKKYKYTYNISETCINV